MKDRWSGPSASRGSAARATMTAATAAGVRVPQQERGRPRPPGVAGRLATSPAMTASSTATTAATASPSSVIVVNWVPAQERAAAEATTVSGSVTAATTAARHAPRQHQQGEHQEQAGRQGEAQCPQRALEVGGRPVDLGVDRDPGQARAHLVEGLLILRG